MTVCISLLETKGKEKKSAFQAKRDGKNKGTRVGACYFFRCAKGT